MNTKGISKHKSFSPPAVENKHKQVKTPLRKQKQPVDSITKVNPFRKHGVGIWKGRRKVVGIRIDEDLYNAFKPVAKRVFGSVCRPVEAFMASVIAMAETGVNFGNTIEVHEIRIERNLRARRGLKLGNFFTGELWKTVDGPFNENGHGVGCSCKWCRGR